MFGGNASSGRFSLWLASTAAIFAALASAPVTGASLEPSPRERLVQIRVPFVENCGQLDGRVAFSAPTFFGAVFVTQEGRLVYSLPDDGSSRWTLTETFLSGNPQPFAGSRTVTGVSCFHGNDPALWQRNLPTYDEVHLGDVWRGISVSLRAHGGNVEKLFTIRPGANARRIRVRLDGARSLRIDATWALVAETDSGTIRFTRPEAYQETGGVRHPVDVAYVLHGSRYGFRLGAHDPSLPVVIDPLLQSTYLSGSDGVGVLDIAVDPASGDIIVCGPSSGDAFVARLNPTLTELLQSTYLGGSDLEVPFGIAIDPADGGIFVGGYTNSSDFPGTTGGAQPSNAGYSDAFVARLNAELTTLNGATYLGGTESDEIMKMALHPATGEVFVAGITGSLDFPGTAGGARTEPAGSFVARLDPTLATLLQSTYLGTGGENLDWAKCIAIDPISGDVLVGGQSSSAGFPGSTGGAQPTQHGDLDGFVARLSPTLTALLQSTYLGGSAEDDVSGIASDPANGDVLVTGTTASSDFPGVSGGAQPTMGGGAYPFIYDGFVARLDPTLTVLLQSTYLGGNGYDASYGIAVEPATGDVFVAGLTQSVDFPGTAGGVQPELNADESAFVARLAPSLTALVQSTYLGNSDPGFAEASGLSVSPDGEVLVIGQTYLTDFPGTAGGAQPIRAHDNEAFIARLSSDLAALLTPVAISIDPLPGPGDGDSVFEPGETVPVIPSWRNQTASPLSPNGQATSFDGPPGATYSIVNGAVSYGEIAPGSVGLAGSAYTVSVSAPSPRPATHWDAVLTETLDVPLVLPYRRLLHIADSFPDVPRSHLFYRDIETVLHHDITAGCGSGNYCPDQPVSRSQIAVLLLKAKHHRGYIPPDCTGVFADVPCEYSWTFVQWIEELFHEGITGGCGGDNYCPDDPVTRAQMAVFLLKSEHGSSYLPPACKGTFGDVTCPSMFADWIEQLAAEQITGGCGGGNYCPNNPSTRGQMAVFLVKTFGLQLYGP